MQIRINQKISVTLAAAAVAVTILGCTHSASGQNSVDSLWHGHPARESVSRQDTNASTPALPVVARIPAQQPQIGLVSDAHLDKAPPRKTVGLDLVRNGWSYNCMECHKLIQSKWHYDRPLNEHQDIHLQHGENRFCLNCHHPTNRNAFVDYDGAEISQADVVQLCAKCHGTIYRDWKAGVHGRQNGFWNTSMGPRTKLRCIQCHDPHSPKFQPMKPLAPLKYPPRAAHPPAGHMEADTHIESR